MITSARAAKGFLEFPGREGVHVGVLEAEVTSVPGGTELDADAVAGVFAGVPGHELLDLDVAVGHDFAGLAEFSGEFFVFEIAAAPFAELEAVADVGQAHSVFFPV